MHEDFYTNISLMVLMSAQTELLLQSAININ